jgi:tyrosinase
MSGDGVFIANQSDIFLGGAVVSAGTGGGCVKSGPFVNMTVNLGPGALDVPGGGVLSNPNGTSSYNPRCLKRSLTDSVNRDYANATSVLNTIAQTNIADFQVFMQGGPGSGASGFGNGVGIHGGGHYSLGGDPSRDFFVSPGDPAFYLHHAMIDRTWWIWQMQDSATRVWSNASIAGGTSMFDFSNSINGTLQDVVQLGYAGGKSHSLGDVMSTLSGPFCYVYL